MANTHIGAISTGARNTQGRSDTKASGGDAKLLFELLSYIEQHGGADVSGSNTTITPDSGIWQFFEDDEDDQTEDELLSRGRDANQVLEHIRQAQSAELMARVVKAQKPELMVQSLVSLGEQTTEGQVIEAVTIAWHKIVDAFIRDPQMMFQLDWRKWEEMIAGAYKADGWEIVILTPRSNDAGRDVIATRQDFGSIRFIEQVKRYSPGHLVTFEDVTALLGVLDLERNVSKGIITTTSDFAPGVYTNERIAELRPNRLDLRPGPELLKWLRSIPRDRVNMGSTGGA